jgi:Phosphomannomutase
VVIKTFVTTDLQKAIANYYGLRCVETLTGFKYIGEKLGKYERAIPEQLRQNYAHLTEQETRRFVLLTPHFMFSAVKKVTATAAPILFAIRTVTAP